MKTSLVLEEYSFLRPFRFWPTAVVVTAPWTGFNARDCAIVVAASAVSIGAASSAADEEKDADVHANKNAEDEDDDDDDDDDDDNDDDADGRFSRKWVWVSWTNKNTVLIHCYHYLLVLHLLNH